MKYNFFWVLSLIMFLVSCVSSPEFYTREYTDAEKQDMENYIGAYSFEPIGDACSSYNPKYSQLPSMLRQYFDKDSVARGKAIFDSGARYQFNSGEGADIVDYGYVGSKNNYIQTIDREYISRYKRDAKAQFRMLSNNQLEQICSKTLSIVWK